MAGEPLISVVMSNYRTLDFVRLNLESLARLTRNPYRVLLNDNGSSADEIEHLRNIAAGDVRITLICSRPETPIPSQAHGEALDILIERATTPYTVVMDTDCVFLLKGWDEAMIGLLDDKTRIVGATSPLNRAGNRAGGGVFPLCFATLFDTRVYKSLRTSCRPGNIRAGEDTCYQWPAAFGRAGYQAKIFVTRNTRDYKAGPFGRLTGIEEYYLDDGRLVAVHFGRGRTGGQGKYLQSFRVPFLAPCIQRYLAAREKKEWMRLCREMIYKM